MTFWKKPSKNENPAMNKTGPLMLIDSNFFCHQARFSLKGLSHEDLETNVIFGFLSRIVSLASSWRTNRFIFCWDSKKSHRKRAFPGYKKGRKNNLSSQDILELKSMYKQADLLHDEILPSIGFRNQFRQSGLEADDLMAWWGKNAAERDEVLIISSDEDMYQSIRANVQIYNPKTAVNSIKTLQWFFQTYRIPPSKWALVKAIGGCSSDKIPGIPRIGEKTALQYLQKTANEKKAQRIRENWHIVEQTLPLVSLPHEKTKPMELQPDVFDFEAVKEICKKYDMKSLLSERNKKFWPQFISGKFKGGI